MTIFPVRHHPVLLTSILALLLICSPALAAKEPAGQQPVSGLAATPSDAALRERLQAIEILIDSGRLDDARRQNRTVLFHSQLARNDELLFHCQWQSARILQKLEQLDDALGMSRVAIETLQRLRNSPRFSGTDCFRTIIRPAYLGLTELLMTKASATVDGAERDRLLKEAVTTVELLRADELKDYLRLPCLPVNDLNLIEQQDLLNRAAVLYLIDFENQIGIIVKHAGRFASFTTPVSTRQVKAEALLMTDAIRSLSDDYREPAHRLYQWLIAPLGPLLDSAETLIIVPDGTTRAIPFPALLDRNGKYLVDRFAVVMNQGLSITSTGDNTGYGTKRFFLGGISEAVAGHNAIPAVSSELQTINSLFPADVLQDRQFTAEQIGRQLNDETPPVVHIASHGQFTGDSSQSFILTWDGRLNIEEIAAITRSGENRGKVVDLVTLSACSTAVGDDRAALGLAGVTLKAGARSAIASLWNVDDESTEKFFVNFYALLQSSPERSKAEVLRSTQRKYLAREITRTGSQPPEGTLHDFTHPFFWAAFILTGNWQ